MGRLETTVERKLYNNLRRYTDLLESIGLWDIDVYIESKLFII